MHCLFITIIIIILYLLHFIQPLSYNSSDCELRLVDSDILTPKEHKQLCIMLTQYPLFMIRLRNEIEYAIQGAVFFEASSFKYFETQCQNIPNMCQYGFLIDIYIEDLVIIIQPGSKSKQLVDDVYRKRTISSVRPELLKGKWHTALNKILTLIIYKEKGGKVKSFPSTSKEPKQFLFYVLIPIICCGFIGLTLLLYYTSKGIINKDEFVFLDKVIELWSSIAVSRDKRIRLEPYVCIFCWQRTNNKREVFMYCGHSYHERCLRKWDLYKYGCCPCSYEAIKEVEEKRTEEEKAITYLTIEDLKILLGLCLDAYRKHSMYDYFVEREKVIEEFNMKYNISLEELCWLYHNKLQEYKTYRLFYKMYKVWKMSCFILAFYPKFLKSKKVKLLTKLLKVKQRGATVEKLD